MRSAINTASKTLTRATHITGQLPASSPFTENFFRPITPSNMPRSSSADSAENHTPSALSILSANVNPSPFLENIGSLPELTSNTTPTSTLPRVQQGYARLIHGTSRAALQNIAEYGITQELYVTSSVEEAQGYAAKQAEYDGTDAMLIIIDAKDIQKNEYDRFYTYDGDIKMAIPVKEKEEPKNKAELDVISKANSIGFTAQLTGGILLMSTPAGLIKIVAAL
jgi:hypothetical protein